MKIKINQEYKSIKPCEFELPDFTVLTGKNGSGKSHLLQAISTKINNVNIADVNINGQVVKNAKYIGFNGLNPNIQEDFDPNIITQYIKNVWQNYGNTLKNFRQQSRVNILNFNKEYFLPRISDSNHKRYINKVINETKKEFHALTETDFYDNFEPSFLNQNDFFTAQFALIFKDYYNKLEENEYNTYRQRNGKPISKLIFAEKEFTDKYGIPPWELINNILDETNIPYKVNCPEGTNRDASFTFKLIDKNQGFDISSNDLSTGEKVLMTLALAIYNTGLDLDVGKPDLLLIDEPDAGLHPSMSKLMVKVLTEHIVKDNNIPVIITTHSPTTVISCEGTAIYKMERNNSIPQPIPMQEALEILTSDIPFLRISTEKRKNVFVENQNDVNYYEQITNIYSNKEQLPSEPKFISTRKSKHSGSNCGDVIVLVNGLSQNGNDQVYGIIDRDEKNQSTGKILVLGNGERYSIENYILDPLLMGLFCIRERKQETNYFGITAFTATPDIKTKLTAEDAQKIVDKVLEDLSLNSNNLVDYKLYNGWILKISTEFNNKQGHDLETLYEEKYAFLKSFSKNQEGVLKKEVIDRIINDYPEFAPVGIIETLKKII